MNILICGADGFLGSAIARACTARGHRVIRGVHRPSQPGDIALDYRHDHAEAVWRPRLAGVDAVVNAVGILREARPGDFDALHALAPTALFRACAQVGLGKVVQISALGAADTDYLHSKHAADKALWEALPRATALRPGLVFGEDGRSTRYFLALASLPLHLIPHGAGPVQPVHVDDVVEAVVRLLETADPPQLLELPGPQAWTYRQWLAAYRARLGLAPAWSMPLPSFVMALAAKVGDILPGSLLCSPTWAMLRAGNTAQTGPARALLGRELTPVPGAASDDGERDRLRALAAWHTSLLRGTLAFLWLATAGVSALGHPLESSLALLAPYGLTGALALTSLIAAITLDALLGLLTLIRPGRRLWLFQIAVILVYSVLLAWKLPDTLLHPFGPVLKNLAVLALLIQLWSEER